MRQHRRKERAIHTLLELAPLGAEPVIGDAAARSEGVHHVRHVTGEQAQQRGKRRQVDGAVRIEKDLVKLGGQTVAALIGGGRRVIDLDETGHGLLLEPSRVRRSSMPRRVASSGVVASGTASSAAYSPRRSPTAMD